MHKPVNHKSRLRGFTLIEMLAVIAVILILAGLVLGVAKYANRQAGMSRARAQLAALEAAVESYKSDWGFYPISNPVRFSGDNNAQLSNSWCLYKALTTPKMYYKANQTDIGRDFIKNWTSATTSTNISLVTFFKDPWGKPWNYYQPYPPTNATLVVSNVVSSAYKSYAVGGQMNPATFDLFSYGPDGATYIPGANATWLMGATRPWQANDDVNNWGR